MAIPGTGTDKSVVYGLWRDRMTFVSFALYDVTSRDAENAKYIRSRAKSISCFTVNCKKKFMKIFMVYPVLHLPTAFTLGNSYFYS